jgi:hypothetical protein
MGNLFTDGRARTDRSTVRVSEFQHSFLDRAPGPLWQRVRDLLETWVDAYPVEHRESIVRRLKLPREDGHRGAWWELYVYSLFRALGATVRVVEPQSETKSPDFLVRLDGQRFYLEATTARGGIGESSRNERRLVELINEIPHPSWLTVKIRILRDGSSGEQPGQFEVVDQICRWISRLTPTETWSACESDTDIFVARDWMIELTPLPARDRDPNMSDMRLIHMGPAKGGAVRDRIALKSALHAKATRYADLDAPLVLAVALFSSFADWESIGEALYGSEAVRFPIDSPELARVERTRDGLYMHTTGVQNTRIAGVIVAGDIQPWHLGRRLPDWWPHPWTSTPVSIGTPFLTCRGTDTGELVLPSLDDGLDPRDAFRLRSDWPGPEAPFAG